jgi:hypothetical protein
VVVDGSWLMEEQIDGMVACGEALADGSGVEEMLP